MVEFNAHGLAGFFTTLKNVSITGLKYGKEYSVKFFEWCVSTARKVKEWFKQKYLAYF